MINNFTKYKNINLIILLIIIIRAKSIYYIKKSLLIYRYQIIKYDYFNIANINNIGKDMVSL